MKRNKIFKIATLGIILILIILLLRKCNSNPTTKRASDFKMDQSFLAIPPEATFIAVFNTAQVLQGIGFDELRRSDEYIDKLKASYDQNPPFTRVFGDPQGVGIDIQKKSVFYLAVGTAAEEIYTNTIFSLANVEAFEEAILKSGRGNFKTTENFKHLKIDLTSSVAWNDNFVSFISTAHTYDKMKIFKRCFTDSSTKYFDQNKKFYDYIFESNSDFAFWVDCTSYSKNQLHATGKPGEISSLLLRGNIIYGDANFRDGEIDANIRFDFNKFLSTAQDKLFKNGYDTKILDLTPDKVPSVLLNTSLNIDGIFSIILNDIDLKLQARNSLANYGLTLDDLSQAIEGDMLITAYPSPEPGKSSTIFAVKIKDHEHFQLLLKVWQDLGIIILEDSNLYRINKGTPPIFPIAATYPDLLQRLFIKGDYAYVSLDNTIIDHIASDQKTKEIAQNLLLDKKEDEILFSGYVDSRIEKVKNITKDYNINEIKFNYADQNLELNFQFENKTTNPLKQIFTMK